MPKLKFFRIDETNRLMILKRECKPHQLLQSLWLYKVMTFTGWSIDHKTLCKAVAEISGRMKQEYGIGLLRYIIAADL